MWNEHALLNLNQVALLISICGAHNKWWCPSLPLHSAFVFVFVLLPSAPESNQLQDAHKNNTKIHSSGKTTTASSVNGDSVCVCVGYTHRCTYVCINIYIYIYICITYISSQVLNWFPSANKLDFCSCVLCFSFPLCFCFSCCCPLYLSLALSLLLWHIKIQSLCYEDK